MKINVEKGKFQPVTLTIESQAELDCLLIALNHTDDSFHYAYSEQGHVEHKAFVEAKKLFGPLFCKLEELY